MGERLPDIILEELKGCDYRIEMGSRHLKIFVNNRLAGIWPKGRDLSETDKRKALNTRAQIRRAKNF